MFQASISTEMQNFNDFFAYEIQKKSICELVAQHMKNEEKKNLFLKLKHDYKNAKVVFEMVFIRRLQYFGHYNQQIKTLFDMPGVSASLMRTQVVLHPSDCPIVGIMTTRSEVIMVLKLKNCYFATLMSM